VQDHVLAGIFRPIQEASVAALSGSQAGVAERVALYQARRDRVVAALAATRVSHVSSQGTFFVWFRLPLDATVEELLIAHRVALAPGEGFGSHGAGWARLSVAIPDDLLDTSLERLRAALA
jgi:aminotransferase